eukprot:CAMPEP_0113934424 /NCGR_PEP_ID=MMETSP1339-20121228/1749_1 /TAXON_ID=94617 /ORGANISM="Fibrocapsa japonica" /LENGTH=184 /DNA_ID=CAMNT_0000936221 /DNA_START=77 /DNA_END=631 /DNA_ORIENTATION=+ /assembly_acc=CAM_ASM_000762
MRYYEKGAQAMLQRLQPRAVIPIKNWNIFTGDKVAVISGKEEGKQGVVRRIRRTRNSVVVEGINFQKFPGSLEDAAPGKAPEDVYREAALHYSQLNLVDPITGEPTRVMWRYLEDGARVRISKKSGAVIPKPEGLGLRKKPRKTATGPRDTPPDDVLQVTFRGIGADGREIGLADYFQTLGVKN